MLSSQSVSCVCSVTISSFDSVGCAAAVARVERYYTDTLMFDRYRRVYEGALAPAAKG